MIEVHHHGDLHEIRLARPPVNALNLDLLTQLRAVVEAAPQQGARGLILSGGPNVFSGGLDVPYLLSCDREGLRDCWSAFFAATRALAEAPVPVVAALAGHSPAGGCVLALACDYRIMARSPDPAKPFRIGLNETQVGLVVPEAIQYMMRRVLGPHRAERLMVAGAMIDAETAARIGLVDDLVEIDDCLPRAMTWLGELAALPQGPMLATRQLARRDLVTALRGFDDAQMQTFLDGWNSTDTQTALHALVAKLKK
ncbi:MAG TPA: enoyl-CoA hydratase/isomerase family protein [Arenimonas sp.]|nr:enoyl-CoA hydratase/isomerase family protein [Arenimonas sp.]